MRHIWASAALPLRLKLRLYAAAVGSVLTYGSEAWILDAATCKAITDANAQMLTHITGQTQHEEATKSTTTFDMVRNIRARRLQWLGHILRMNDQRLVKRAAFHIFTHRQEGDLCMDAPAVTRWEDLVDRAKDRETWRGRVKVLKCSPGRRWQLMAKKVLGRDSRHGRK